MCWRAKSITATVSAIAASSAPATSSGRPPVAASCTRKCRAAIPRDAGTASNSGRTSRASQDGELRYQDVPATAIPEVIDDDGTSVRVICGETGARRARSTASPRSRAISMSLCRGKKKSRGRGFPPGLAYIFEGRRCSPTRPNPSACCGKLKSTVKRWWCATRSQPTLVVFGSGDEIVVQAGEEGVRFLLVSGRPLREPIAWHGPIVMNT